MARVYRNISQPVLFFNMELIDLGVIFAGMVLSFVLTNNAAISVGVTLLLFFGIRYFKRGRAPGFFIHLMRFISSQGTSGVGLKDRLPTYIDQ